MLFKNITTISMTFLTMISINLFASDPCKGMFRYSGEEEESNPKLTIQKSQKEWEETKATEKSDTSSSRPVQQDSLFEILSDDTLLYIFSLLRTEDLGRTSQVSTRWREICSVLYLWEKVGLENYRDYFTVIDLKEKPKEKVIHHYLSVTLNVLYFSEEDGICKNFRKKYSLSSFIPCFKTYLPKKVQSFHEDFSAKIYGKFEMPQDIEIKKETEKLRSQRDDLIKQAISESRIETVPNPYHRYSGYYMGGKECISSIGRNPTMEHPVPNKMHLRSAGKVNERLILLGDEDAARKKKEQLTTRYSEYAGLNNLYQADENWDNFVKSSVDEFCSKGYLFGFEWKIEWLLEKNENGAEFIESMLQNNNPIIRNMGHYVRVFALKQGKLGYKKDHDKAVEYIRLYNIPY